MGCLAMLPISHFERHLLLQATCLFYRGKPFSVAKKPPGIRVFWGGGEEGSNFLLPSSFQPINIIQIPSCQRMYDSGDVILHLPLESTGLFMTPFANMNSTGMGEVTGLK